jgi:predicted AAA+ superfamily ATPase
MIPRYLQPSVLNSLQHFPVALLTGARQVGKSTLAQDLIGKSWQASYLTLDDRVVLDGALRDPDGLISATPTPVVLDEVQKAPDLLRAIKRRVDREKAAGQYLLTGSANLMTLASVSETLAGRVALHTLMPFGWPERTERPAPTILKDLFEAQTSSALLKKLPKTTGSDSRKEIISTILSGGYPEPALMKSSEVRHRWFDSYRQTYLERDLLSIKSIENIPDFNRLLSLMAFRTGGLLNLSDLSRETGLPFTTLRRYMNLLEATYQVFLLTPYYANIGKRLVKTPKVFMNDTGMACYLRGVDDWSALEHQGQVGSMVETWAAAEILKLMTVTDYRFHLYFWRTHAGHEVDFLLERGGKLVAIEVKWSSSVDESALSSLERCHDDLKGKLLRSVILYGGTDVVALTPKTIAIPYPIFFGT